MKILAFDTSTDMCSVALQVDGEVLLRHQNLPRRHAELLLPWCDELLASAQLSLAQLDILGFGCGPGAFTGVRIAVSAVQGMALATDLPVAPVSSLAALALGAYGSLAAKNAGSGDSGPLGDRLVAMLDARMNEVYWGAYQISGGKLAVTLADRLDAPQSVCLPSEQAWSGVGQGFASYAGVLTPQLTNGLSQIQAEHWPHAAAVAQLAQDIHERGEGVAAELAQPVYLRDRVTH